MIDAYSVPCAPDDEREHRPRSGAVHHDDRNVEPASTPAGTLIAPRPLSARGRGRADGERRAGILTFFVASGCSRTFSEDQRNDSHTTTFPHRLLQSA